MPVFDQSRELDIAVPRRIGKERIDKAIGPAVQDCPDDVPILRRADKEGAAGRKGQLNSVPFEEAAHKTGGFDFVHAEEEFDGGQIAP